MEAHQRYIGTENTEIYQICFKLINWSKSSCIEIGQVFTNRDWSKTFPYRDWSKANHLENGLKLYMLRVIKGYVQMQFQIAVIGPSLSTKKFVKFCKIAITKLAFKIYIFKSSSRIVQHIIYTIIDSLVCLLQTIGHCQERKLAKHAKSVKPA